MQYNKGSFPANQEEYFESWLSNNLRKEFRQKSSLRPAEEELVEIPVVVHIIHNGEPIGTGTNISDEQVQSQIDVLNEDFRRLNGDRTNTPSEFVSVAADINVEFVMARRNPEGLSTSAIVREQGTQTEWDIRDHAVLKALSYWPAENYFNIWVTAVGSPLLGFAQFPTSDELNGLESASSNPLTDGIVIDYEVFGSVEKYPDANLKTNFNKGRTTTHEVGHFLGLRHIWGDSGSGQCTTDYCDDTPPQSTDTNGCPSHPAGGGCGTNMKMFQNYMDYTNDQCMNLFTIDQRERMRTVLENSPRRKSLTTSPALLPAVVHDYDLGLFSVLSPQSTTCDATATPSVLVKNYGNITLNNALIKLTVNESLQQTVNASFSGLAQLETETISFTDIPLTTGNNTLTFEVISVNSNTDQGTGNNMITTTVTLPDVGEGDLTQDFENGIQSMSIRNEDGLMTWEIVNAPNGITSNNAIALDCFDYENAGAQDWLLSPVMDFSALSVAQLIFDYAYAQYPGSQEELRVLVSEDCGSTFQEVFSKSGAALSTTGSAISQEFIPAGADDWSSASIDLSSYIGSSSIQVAFIGKNDFGNNLYLDNISLVTTDGVNIGLIAISSPAIVVGSTDIPVDINVKNKGNKVITSLQVTYTVDGGNPVQKSIDGFSISSGKISRLHIGDISLEEGLHETSVILSQPNGQADDPSDNSMHQEFIIDLSEDAIPLLESFETTSDWVKASPSEVSWEEVVINNNHHMYVNSFEQATIGAQAWLVSPVLDLSSTSEASVFYDWSYAKSTRNSYETLTILLSLDGGLDGYPIVLKNLTGNDLVTYEQVQDNWVPESNSPAHWKTSKIDLTPYTGENRIRIAYKLTNAYGNNIYLDNIEFFESREDERPDIGTREVLHFPNPIQLSKSTQLHLVFNLIERQKAEIRIYDLAGNQVFSQSEAQALNQIYQYDMSQLSSGMFILSVIGESFQYNTRIVIAR